MNKKLISIEKDFTWAPAGRYKKHGKFTGQVFREDHLVPALNDEESVAVNLDGVIGYGSSFIEEAFGGLIREEGFSYATLQKKLSIETQEFPSIKKEIWDYIKAAERANKKS